MSDLGTLLLRLAADAGQFESDLGRAARIAEKRGQEIERRFKQVGAVIGAGLATAVTALTALTKNAIDTADKFALMSQKVGVSVETLSTLTYAAEQSGVQVDQLQSGMVKLAKNASDAAMGVGTAVNGFDALGISVKNADGSLKGTDVLLGEIAGKFSQYQDGANKTALAVNLFGRAGAELIPLLNEGADGIEELQQRAKDLGLQIGGETAAAADAFNDQMDDLGHLVKGFGNDLAAAVLPSLVGFTKGMVDAGIEGRKAGNDFAFVKEAVDFLLVTFIKGVEIVQNIGAAFGFLVDTIGDVTGAIRGSAGPLMSYFDALKSALSGDVAGAVEKYKAALSAAQKVGNAFGQSIRSNAGALKDSFAANAQDAQRKIDALAQGTAGLNTQLGAGDGGSDGRGLAPAMRNVAGATADAEKAMKELEKRNRDYANWLERAAQEEREWVERQRETAAALRRRFDEQERDLKNEIRLLGLTGEARDRLRRRLEAENMARDENGNVIRAQADEFERLLEQYDRAAMSSQQAEAFQSAWTGAIGNIASAFGDWVVNGFKDFSSFVDNVKNAFKRMIADMIAQMVQSGLMRMLAGLFGGAGGGFWSSVASAGAAAMGGGGSGGGGFGGMTSLLGGNGSMLGTAGNFAAAAPWALPAAGAIGGALYGAQNRPNMGSRVAAGAAYGYAGYALGTVATGALIGAGAGAATGVAGAAAGGAMAGGAGAAAAIPVVGWIIAALALIDAFSGGKLFGTSFQTRGATQTFGVGPNGGTASLTLQQERQRALFGGLARRNVSRPATDDMRDAADQLYQQNLQLVEGVNRALMGDIDELLQGSIRVVQRYSKKGKLESTKYFVDILGRSWEESTMELAQTRMGAEQIISAIDRIMDVQVEDIAQAVARPFGRRFEDAFVDAMSETRMVGEASAIAERWRDDAQVLLEGAQTLLTIAGDIRNGFDLLGTGTLTPIVDLITDLAYSGETMLQTYQRLAASTVSLESALDLMGVTLDLGREAFVRFATDITEAAGGLEAANALWSDYFTRYFSETERAALALANVTEQAAGMFEAIGLSVEDFTGSTGLADFRALFESTLPTLTADQVVQWLQAAQALGLLTETTAAYNQLLAQTTQAVAGAVLVLSELPIPEFPWDDSNVGPVWTPPPPPELPEWLRDPTWGIGTPPPPLGAGNDIDREIERRYEMEMRWLERLMALQDSLMLDDRLSTLTPAEMLAEAERQYEAALAGAIAGNEEARSIYDAATRNYLEQARDFWASSPEYTRIFGAVQSDIAGLIRTSPANTAVTAEASAAAAVNELKALREDGDDQTEALVLAIGELRAEAQESRLVQTQIVNELRRLSQQSRVGG